ncbi:MAG: T9SS type A sorting domain-containing protein, partial [candidate division Zixibacteria bacterium]|nr:T9SS type A sorting domain-containing protein [Candidatus Tariuqbacter arcticus]
LSPAYPNAFYPTRAISYQLQAASFVKLVVYDIQGREVARLVDGYRAAGSYELTFDGSDLASGVYLARLNINGNTLTQKLLLIK